MVTIRSLADDLRQREDAALAQLLRQRPDLLRPVPSDITALTTRATTGPSVSRCLDGLDTVDLHVLRVAAELSAEKAVSAADIVKLSAHSLGGGSTTACELALDHLRTAALVWGSVDELRAVHVVRDLVGPHTVPRWPRPELTIRVRHDQHVVDEEAALHGRAAVARVRDLIDEWSANPPGILRSGGLALRDFAAVSRSLHAEWPVASLTIELAHAARLVADDEEESPHWVPTDHADAWLARTPAEQWLELVEAWLTIPRLAWRADEKTQVLSSDRDRRAVPILRGQVLDLLVELPAGAALDPDEAAAVLDDRQPRRGGELRRQTLDSTLAEAAELGIVGSGSASTAARLLLTPTEEGSADRRTRAARISAALADALPADVDYVLVQADLTIVAPGPLTTSVARSLRLLADIESRGHATVYRIGEASIRRALDAGWDAPTIHSTLAAMSRTPVPQPLTYLIDDTARRHGAVRVGHALGYLRCDNPQTLAELLADRRMRTLGLSRVAETVLIAQAPASEILGTLRAAGYAPAAESPDGAVIIRRADDRRIPAPRSHSVSTRRPPEEALISAAVRGLRAGDRATGHRPVVLGPAASTAPSLSTNAIVATLRAALADSAPAWIGYADNDGTVTEQIVDPIRLGGGVLTAFDHRTEQVRTFTVARITGVAPAGPDGD
jgi:hypothetical protein